MATGTGLPLPQRRPVLAQSAPIVRADPGTAQAWQALGQVAERVGDQITDLAMQEQKQATARYVAESEIQFRRRRVEIEAEHPDNPQAAQASWQGYVDGVIEGADPRLLPQLKLALDAEGVSLYGEVLKRRRGLDRQLAEEGLTARLKMAGDDVLRFAMDGKVATPDFVNARATYEGLLGTMRESGFLSDDEAVLRMEDLDGRATAEMIVRSVGETYRRRGAEAALATVRGDLLAAGLPPDLARSYEAKAEADVRGWESERKADLSIARSESTELRTRLKAMEDVPDDIIADTTSRLLAAGGYREAAALQSAAITRNRLFNIGRLPLDQMVEQVRLIEEGLTAPPDLADRIVMAESGGRADARNPRSSATGAGQFLDSTWLDLVRRRAPERRRVSALSGRPVLQNEDGTFSTEETITVEMDGRFMNIPTIWDGQRVPEAEAIERARRSGQDFPTFDTLPAAEQAARERTNALGEAGTRDLTDAEILALRSDPALSRRMVAAYAEENARYLSERGLPTDDGALYLSHHFGPAGAAQILEAAPTARAADFLPADVIKANPHLEGMTAGDLRAWADQRVGGVAATMAADLSLVSGARKAIAAKAQAEWSRIEKGLNADIRPDADSLTDVIEAAALAQDHDLLEEIVARLETAGFAEALSGASLTDISRTRTALEQEAATTGLPPGRAAMLQAIRDLETSTREGLKSDPLGLAVNRGIVAPLPDVDWSSPDQAAGALRVRERTARMVGQHYGTGPVPVFRPDEMARLKSAWDQGDSATRTRLLGTLAGSLDGDHLKATLEKIAPDRPTLAEGGILYQKNPEVALSIVRGLAILADDKRVAPADSQEFRTAVNDYFGTALAGTSRRSMLPQLALARYADMAASEGNYSGILDTELMDRALFDVTGGVVEWNGRKVIAPRPGLGERDFGRIMESLTTDDLPGIQTPDGKPIPISMIKDKATLQDFGDGQYLVWIGSRAVMGADGDPFILDLSKREVPQKVVGGFDTDAYRAAITTGGAAATYNPAAPPSSAGIDRNSQRLIGGMDSDAFIRVGRPDFSGLLPR